MRTCGRNIVMRTIEADFQQAVQDQHTRRRRQQQRRRICSAMSDQKECHRHDHELTTVSVPRAVTSSMTASRPWVWWAPIQRITASSNRCRSRFDVTGEYQECHDTQRRPHQTGDQKNSQRAHGACCFPIGDAERVVRKI